MSWTTCQPPSPSGTVMVVFSDPPTGEAVPSGVDAKAQQVLAQSTRLPTTVDQTRLTGEAVDRPDAVSVTLVSTGPIDDASAAVTLVLTARPLVANVVRALTVGATSTGQSIEGAGATAPWVTVKVTLAPFVYGIGDWGTFRYM